MDLFRRQLKASPRVVKAGVLIAIVYVVGITSLLSPEPDSADTPNHGTIEGFQPNWWTASYILCPNRMEYGVAAFIVPYMWKIGFTPNRIVALNSAFRLLCLHQHRTYKYITVQVLLVIIQILDASDGYMARSFNMTSQLGHTFDHVTDEVFTAFFMAISLNLVRLRSGLKSFKLFSMATLFCFMLVIAVLYMRAKESGKRYEDCNFLEVAGMYQMMHMSYIEIVVVNACTWVFLCVPVPMLD